MNIKEIVESWLKQNGYDGLAGDGCGCEVSDLMPCGSPSEITCVAGYKVPCTGGEDCPADGYCPWHISSTKS